MDQVTGLYKQEVDSNWSESCEPPCSVGDQGKKAPPRLQSGVKSMKKELNKLAQKRYRERAKMKAGALQHKTEALAKSLEQAEQEKRALEVELNALRLRADPDCCRASQPFANIEQAEEDFVPSAGWSGYNPDGRGSIVLRIICNPPKRLSLEQALKLTVDDLRGFIREVVFKAGQLLLEDPEGDINGKPGRQLSELVREMCGFACYMACWRPVLYQRLHCFNLADPNVPLSAPDATFHRGLLKRLDLGDEQKKLMAVAYRCYAKKMQLVLLQRQQLRAALLEASSEMDSEADWPMWHTGSYPSQREKQAVKMLQENIIAEHVAVFVLWGCITHHACAFTDVQIAKFMLASWPNKADAASLLYYIDQELDWQPPADEFSPACQAPAFRAEDTLGDSGLQPHRLILKRMSQSYLSIPAHYRGPEISKAFASLQF